MKVGGHRYSPGRVTPGKETQCPSVPIVGEAWWPSVLVWTGEENLSTGIRSLDCAAHGESLYRLSCRNPHWYRVKEYGGSPFWFIRGSYRKSWATFFFACELGTAEEGQCGGRWNQLLCYPWVSCDVNSLHHVTSITPNKIADNDMSFRQRAVIEFRVKEEIPAAEIHQRLQRAYGSVCMAASSVRRWVKHFKDGKTEAIQKAVRQCLRMAGTDFYRRGIFRLPERREKCVQRSGDYVEK